MAKLKKFKSSAKLWTVRLRDANGWRANMNTVYGGFSTLKFNSYSAALAHARSQNLSPIDFVICLTQFNAKDIEVREITYDSTTVAIAK